MKKILIFIAIIANMVFAQRQTFFNKNLYQSPSDTSAGTLTTSFKSAYIGKYGNTQGLTTVHLNYDSVATSCADDSFVVFPLYDFAGTQVTGDTLQFYRLGSDTAFTDSTKIITAAQKDWAMAAYINPSPSGNKPTTLKHLGYEYLGFSIKKISAVQGKIRIDVVFDN